MQQFTVTQYVFQTIFHSLIVAVAVELLLGIWRESRPQILMRFRMLTITLPLVSFPVFQLLRPDRGSFLFRKDIAIFDLNQWLLLRPAEGILLWHALTALLAATILIFLFQDLSPFFASRLQGSKRPASLRWNEIRRRLAKRFARLPDIFVFPSVAPVVYTRGSWRPAIYISSALEERLDDQELEAILSHEMAHVTRNDSAAGWLLLLMRAFVFFNPVALIEFRRILHDREKLCDDLAISSGLRLPLASALTKVYRLAEASYESGVLHNLELHSQRVRIEDRVLRIVRSEKQFAQPLPNLRFASSTIAIFLLLFFVV